MNPNSTHADWHPGEDDDYLSAAIDRVRKAYSMSDYAVDEWYLGGGTYSGERLRRYERYSEARGAAKTEVSIERTARQAPAPIAPRTNRGRMRNVRCAQCNDVFPAINTQRKFCTAECQRAYHKERAA